MDMAAGGPSRVPERHVVRHLRVSGIQDYFSDALFSQ
jgi:hypothetical protein